MPVVTYLFSPEMSKRVDVISFFGITFLILTLLVKLIWNRLACDFPALPRISYFRALGFVFLWSCLFLLVLTMISGARELLTPGAWDTSGPTAKLKQATDER